MRSAEALVFFDNGVHGLNDGGLEALLNEIKSAGGVSLTKTLVVLSTVKEDYSVNLE